MTNPLGPRASIRTTVVDTFPDPDGIMRANVGADDFITEETARGMATIQATAYLAIVAGRSLNGDLESLPALRTSPSTIEYHFIEPAFAVETGE